MQIKHRYEEDLHRLEAKSFEQYKVDIREAKKRVGKKRKDVGRRTQEDYEGYNDRRASSQVGWSR